MLAAIVTLCRLDAWHPAADQVIDDTCPLAILLGYKLCLLTT